MRGGLGALLSRQTATCIDCVRAVRGLPCLLVSLMAVAAAKGACGVVPPPHAFARSRAYKF